jgi:hypothetical protein
MNQSPFPCMTQESKSDLAILLKSLQDNQNFAFVRFSDGEMEILNNQELIIGPNYVKTSVGQVTFAYPLYDYKEFIPERDFLFRGKLIEAARFMSEGFIKGIRTKSNDGSQDQQKMIQFNDGQLCNLTYTDLLINSNFRTFRERFMPIFYNWPNLYIIANFRTTLISEFKHCQFIPIQDNFIPDFESQLGKIMSILVAAPSNSLVLSSASSLSNIVGLELWKMRKDLTFIDIGTALHDKLGLGFGIREYHQVLEPIRAKTLPRRMRYLVSKGYKMKW